MQCASSDNPARRVWRTKSIEDCFIPLARRTTGEIANGGGDAAIAQTRHSHRVGRTTRAAATQQTSARSHFSQHTLYFEPHSCRRFGRTRVADGVRKTCTIVAIRARTMRVSAVLVP